MVLTHIILANRTTGRQEGYDGINGSTNDEVMVFVIDESGSTKYVRKKYWCEYIRLVSMQGMATTDIMEEGFDGLRPQLKDDTMMARSVGMNKDDSNSTAVNEKPSIAPPIETRDVLRNQDILNNTIHSQNDVVLCQQILAYQEINHPPHR